VVALRRLVVFLAVLRRVGMPRAFLMAVKEKPGGVRRVREERRMGISNVL